MTFSGALTLTDLNDFIAPSQACIKPVEQVITTPIREKEPGAASTEIHIDSTGDYYEVDQATGKAATSGTKLEQAQISLNDCLACSGCITSAESVLITLQSHTEVLNFLESNKAVQDPKDMKVPVISIAPQTLASLAASLSATMPWSSQSSRPIITPRQVLRRIRSFCKEALGFEHVFDTTFARHLALNEHLREFLERRQRHESQNGPSANLPMLASACPGWICYAEKTHPEMLPFISTTKSPQQVMGTLVKNWMGSKWCRTPDQIYHVCVMPCYDKKLEASRTDFYNEVYATRDVDCVITTGELYIMMQDKGWDLANPVPGELDPPCGVESDVFSDNSLPELVAHVGTSSGSYLHSIITHLLSTSAVPLTLEVKQIRNVDYEDYSLHKTDEYGEDVVVFKGARCYGFRNLQNVVRKIGKERGVRTGVGAAGRLAGDIGNARSSLVSRKGRKAAGTTAGSGSRSYDYVEVMACPGGCVNGGGQLKPQLADAEGYPRNWDDAGVMVDIAGSNEGSRWGNKDWTKKVEDMYWQDWVGPVLTRLNAEQTAIGRTDSITAQLMDRVVGELCQTDEGLGDVDVCAEKDRCRKRFFRTQYKAVESEVIGLAVKW